jgi:hypothetical protein
MNDLYLIGNGFDLAHGLKTSYNDFLLWYINNALHSCNGKGSFKDELIAINRDGYQYSSLENYISIKEIMEDMKKMRFSIKYHHDFFKSIVENCWEYKWVDIEYEYYMALVEIFKEMEKKGTIRSDFHFTQVRVLNDCFENIREKLIKYLNTITISELSQINRIGKKLKEYTGIDASDSGKKLILNFNYTSTIDLYYDWNFNKNVQLIHIHGKLNDKTNPIIFGYGDEIDGYFNRMKQLNRNEFLKNMKSFEYLETSNNQKLNSFLEEESYTVKIMGHSCGVSDRVLLNKIFEHPNCHKIKIFFHETKVGNDFSDKVKDISRHLEKKNVLDLVCERGISEPLIPYQEQIISVQQFN